MNQDYYGRVNGVREPDPTLGKKSSRVAQEPAAVESVPTAAVDFAAGTVEPEPHTKPRRQRVVLADPGKPTTTLRARVELEEQTSWGEVLVKELVTTQLRTGVLLALLVVVLLGSLPLVFYFSPTFAGLSVIGIPVAWVLLGVAPFPLLFLVGLWYNRLAEKHERDFVDMIEN
jgi:hypothetical protein